MFSALEHDSIHNVLSAWVFLQNEHVNLQSVVYYTALN